MSKTGSIVRVDFATSADFDRWQTFISQRSDTHCTDSGHWRRFYQALYDIPSYAYLFEAGGVVRGAASLYHFRSPFMGNLLVTNPFFGYGGFYADDNTARDALLAKIRAKAIDLGVDTIELRLRETLPPPFSTATDFLESDLELRETSGHVWTQQLSSNVRQNIRRARKSDLTFRLSTDHRPCFGLLQETLRAHGTPFHGEAMFELLREHFAAETSFSEVWHQDELMAAGVVMCFGNSAITPFIGSLKEHGHLRANYLQYWGIIEHCLAQGIPRFEFGRSPRDSTHIQFKRKWGARDVDIVYNYLMVNPKKRYRNVTNLPPIYRLATHTWKRLPLAVTNILGPRLARYVP